MDKVKDEEKCKRGRGMWERILVVYVFFHGRSSGDVGIKKAFWKVLVVGEFWRVWKGKAGELEELLYGLCRRLQ